ncbi:MAG: hypothetical protein MJE63_32405 [Proteobacteria bacterium]|nr:hypothetical protein [Pseudomonadota bacterium]
MTRAAFSDVTKTPGGICKLLIYFITPLLLVSSIHRDILAADIQLSKQQQFNYATHLYKSREYYRAITEYKRLIFFFPEDELAETALMQIGRSYLAGSQIENAIDHWELQLQRSELEADRLERMRILLGISLLDLKQTAIFSFREQNIGKAIEIFKELDDTDPYAPAIQRFIAAWDNRTIDKKSPWLAGSLSAIIPGAGSYYTGRYMEGTYAFFLTALFYLATMDAVSNDAKESGAVFGLLTIGFYGGSIYTAVNGAHKLNDKRESDELLRLRQKHGIWFIPATDKYPGRF